MALSFTRANVGLYASPVSLCVPKPSMRVYGAFLCATTRRQRVTLCFIAVQPLFTAFGSLKPREAWQLGTLHSGYFNLDSATNVAAATTHL